MRTKQGIGRNRRYVGKRRLARADMSVSRIRLFEQPQLEVVTLPEPCIVLLGKHALIALDSLAQHQMQYGAGTPQRSQQADGDRLYCCLRLAEPGDELVHDGKQMSAELYLARHLQMPTQSDDKACVRKQCIRRQSGPWGQLLRIGTQEAGSRVDLSHTVIRLDERRQGNGIEATLERRGSGGFKGRKVEQLVGSKTVEALVARAISYMLFLRRGDPVLLLKDPGALSKEEREFLRFVDAVLVDEEEERDLGVTARLELVIERKPQLHEPRRRDDFTTGIGFDHATSPGIIDGDFGPGRPFTGKGDALSVEHDEVLTGEAEPFQTRDTHLVERLDEENERHGVKLVAGIAQSERDLNEGKVHQSMRKRTPGHGQFGRRHDDAVDAVFEGSHRRPRIIRCGGADLTSFHLRHVVDGGRYQRQDECAAFIRPNALGMTGQAQLCQTLAGQIVP